MSGWCHIWAGDVSFFQISSPWAGPVKKAYAVCLAYHVNLLARSLFNTTRLLVFNTDSASTALLFQPAQTNKKDSRSCMGRGLPIKHKQKTWSNDQYARDWVQQSVHVHDYLRNRTIGSNSDGTSHKKKQCFFLAAQHFQNCSIWKIKVP